MHDEDIFDTEIEISKNPFKRKLNTFHNSTPTTSKKIKSTFEKTTKIPGETLSDQFNRMYQDDEEKGEEENDEETGEENEDYETSQMWQNHTNFSKNKNENKIDLRSRNEQLYDNFKKKT